MGILQKKERKYMQRGYIQKKNTQGVDIYNKIISQKKEREQIQKKDTYRNGIYTE